jgi:hypothetical protein
MIRAIRQYLARRRLAKTMRPDPAYAKRRAAQMQGESRGRWNMIVRSL